MRRGMVMLRDLNGSDWLRNTGGYGLNFCSVMVLVMWLPHITSHRIMEVSTCMVLE